MTHNRSEKRLRCEGYPSHPWRKRKGAYFDFGVGGGGGCFHGWGCPAPLTFEGYIGLKFYHNNRFKINLEIWVRGCSAKIHIGKKNPETVKFSIVLYRITTVCFFLFWDLLFLSSFQNAPESLPVEVALSKEIKLHEVFAFFSTFLWNKCISFCCFSRKQSKVLVYEKRGTHAHTTAHPYSFRCRHWNPRNFQLRIPSYGLNIKTILTIKNPYFVVETLVRVL